MSAATPEAGAPGLAQTLLQRDVVHALFAQTRQGIVVGLALAAFFAPLFAAQVGPVWAWSWFAAMMLCCASGAWAHARYQRVSSVRADWPTAGLRRLFTLQGWFKAVVLGWMGWLFYAPELGELRWVTVLAVCAMAAGTVTSYAYHLPAYWGFLVLMCAPLWLKMALTGGMGGWAGHAVFAAYMLALVGFARNQASVLLESIRIRHENRGLVLQLQKQAQDLESANQSKARFFAAASHDLRQPLQALGYYSTLLQPHAQDAPLVERIQQCVDALDGLLEGVLSISRLDAGKVQSQRAAVDCGQLLSRLTAQYQGMAIAKGLTLKLAVSRRPGCWADTDPLLLERVAGNLLHNALRYTLQGGVLLTLRPRQGGVQLRVIDTGLGIASQDLAGIFDEFVQLNNPQRDATQGVGLGLATVKRLCALLAHALTVRSLVGKGSVFSLQLPACAAPLAPLEIAAPQTTWQMKGRVLVVEDNALVREALSNTLQRWGLDCDTFTDGASALAQARAVRYNAAISDWRLPGDLNGTQVLAQLRAMQPALAVAILLTGELDGATRLQADIHLLQKPLRPLRLRALLSAHLGAVD